MIHVQDAKNQIQVGTEELMPINILLHHCVGYAAATDIFSPLDFPDCEQSAMDGYGICLGTNPISSIFKVTGEQQTGNIDVTHQIQQAQAIRIFTGAKIPEGIDTVIQQEWIDRNGNEIKVMDFSVKKGMNIRTKGSQTQKGELVIKKGTSLTPGAVSLLAGLGYDNIEIISQPRVIIVNTGKELVAPGNEIQSGQVYESNSFALNHALLQMNIKPIEILWVDDDKQKLTDELSRTLAKCDLLLITGGVSVGDYDFVVAALEANDVEQIFHKVKQKPGKPLYFGKKGKTMVFGLPGNPASVLTCFYQFGIPCIRKMMGFSDTDLKEIFMPSLQYFEKKPGLTHFLKGKLHSHGVEILAHQESYKMNTYATADVLIEIEEERTFVHVNDLVKVYLI